MRIRRINAVYIGPDHQLVGIHNVRHDRSGKIRAVPAKRGNSSVRCCSDKAGHHRHGPLFQERQKNPLPAKFGLFQVWLSVAEGIAGQHEVRRTHGDRSNFQSLQRGRKQPGAEPLPKRSQPVGKLSARCGLIAAQDFVHQVASQELQLMAHMAIRLFVQPQILQHFQMQLEDNFRFPPRIRQLACRQRFFNGKEMVRDALHRGDNHCHPRYFGRFSHQPGCMEHAFGAQQRAAAKLECHYFAATLTDPAAIKRLAGPCGRALSCCLFGYVFLVHDLRSWLIPSPAAGASLEGV